MCLLLFSNYRSLEKGRALHLNKLESPPPKEVCAKFGWNWHSGSVEEFFFISLMYFRYFVNISPWKMTGSFFWKKTWISSSKDACTKIGWNWSSGSGVKFSKILLVNFGYFVLYFTLEKRRALHWNKFEYPLSKDALCRVWLKLAPCFWRRRFFKISLN